MTNKYIGIYTSATTSETIRYWDIYWRDAYEGLFYEVLKLGYVMVLVYDQENTYLGDGRFKEYWETYLDENDKVSFVHRDEEIKLGFIFVKNRFSASDVAVSDPLEVREICRDKYQSYLFLPELHAQSFLLENSIQLEVFKKSHENQRVALKELDSNGGKKVFVGLLSDYKDDLEFPLLAQEFIDTSVGVPGICPGEHDLRIVVYNGEIISCLLRLPPKGGHKSNIAYGGGYEELDLDKIPQELFELTLKIDERFDTDKDRFYSIDFANTAAGWRVFELNAWPGLGYETENEKKYTKRLAKCLVGSLERQGAINMEDK